MLYHNSFFCRSKLTNIDHESFHSQIVCILAVPATMTCHDLLMYTAACHNNIQHVRIIRDGSVNQYMALIYFRTKVCKTILLFTHFFEKILYEV